VRLPHRIVGNRSAISRRVISQNIGRGECSLTVEPAHTTGPMPVIAESARRTSPVCTRRLRNDSITASIAGAHRTQMTGWGNVARAAISGVLPTF
jgi:hypothetical protein